MDSRASQGESLLNPLSPPHLPTLPCRTPHYRPLSFEPASVQPLDELNVPKSCLPLTLHCTTCLRTSTWYNPMHRNFKPNSPLDILPSLSNSSHSTSSEPSSIGTEFFSSIMMSPSTDCPCAAGVSGNFEDPSITSDGSDDNTPVALSHKSPASDRQASSRINSWIGGGLHGVCSSCHLSSPTGAETSSTLGLTTPHLDDSEMAVPKSGPIPLLSDSHISRYPRIPCSTSLADTSPADTSLADTSRAHQIARPADSQPLPPTSQYPTGGIAPTLSKRSLAPSSTLAKPSAKVPFVSELDGSRSEGVRAATALLIHRPGRATAYDAHVLPNLPLSTDLPGLEYTAPPPTLTRKKSPPILTKDLQTTTMPVELINKCEVVASDSTDSLRHDLNHRGTTLRALLREAKIPQSDSDELINSSRRHPTAVEKWQAAMIATPRDHLRQGDLPTWQLYGATDSPFYQHLCGLSASTGSLSGKETLFSASVTSFRDGPHENSRSCSPVSELLVKTEASILNRRPSHSRQQISSTMVNQTPSDFSSFPADAGRYLSASSPNESQEILSGTVLAKATRRAPSNLSLITRLTSIHPSSSRIGKGDKRRPNTATGTTQSLSIAQPTLKPGPRGTPSPSASLLPSLFSAGSKAVSSEARITNANKRPATATCSGTRSELTLPLSLVTRPLPIQRPATGKNSIAFVPTPATIPARVARNDTLDVMSERHPISLSLRELDIRLPQIPPRDSSSPAKLSAASASPKSSVQSCQGSPVQMSQSVPNFLLKTRFPPPKRNAFYAAATLAVTSDQLMDPAIKDSNVEVSPWLQHEDFQSKSRNFILSVLPRPTASTFSPGQKLSVHLKLSNKVKVRKYTSIYLLLVGSITSDNAPQPNTHVFLRHNYLVYPTPSEEVKIISNSGDLSEWHLELNLPEYANCYCTPGPLPLPSTGTHAAGTVSYSIQLHADRKQLLSNQESLSVKMNMMTRAEARYQVTTRSIRTIARKGRIPFDGGYLGSIEQLSLSHQVYYQSADRLRIGYQFELELSSNSFLPSSVAEEVSRATIIQVHNLMRLKPNDCALKFTDHRSKIAVIPPDEKGGCVKWIIKGFLELKAVSQQMQAVKATLEGTPRTPRRRENTMGSRSMLSSSHGNNSLGGGLTTPLGTSLQQETERQAKLNSSQLFLIANVDHCPGVLIKPVEISSLIGSELLSPCSLRKLGDEMMKQVIMAEKMKRVQEENFKHDQ